MTVLFSGEEMFLRALYGIFEGDLERCHFFLVFLAPVAKLISGEEPLVQP